MKIKKLLAYTNAVESLRASTDAIICIGGIQYGFTGRCGSNPQVEFSQYSIEKAPNMLVMNHRYTMVISNPFNDGFEAIPGHIVAPAFDSLKQICPAIVPSFEGIAGVCVVHTHQADSAGVWKSAPKTNRVELSKAAKHTEEFLVPGVSLDRKIQLITEALIFSGHLEKWESIHVTEEEENGVRYAKFLIKTNDYFNGRYEEVYQIEVGNARKRVYAHYDDNDKLQKGMYFLKGEFLTEGNYAPEAGTVTDVYGNQFSVLFDTVPQETEPAVVA